MPTFPLGALQRPHDPRETAYRLPVPTTVDLQTPVDLAAFLPEPMEQGSMGACVAHAVVQAAMTCATIQGVPRPEVDVSRLFVYARGRQKENTFPADSGMYPADGFDVSLGGIPKESLLPYRPDPTLDAPAALNADCPNQNWLQGHQPFYRSDPGGFLAGTVTALRNRQPVVLAMAWYSDFDTPTVDGVLPAAVTGQVRGGHAVLVTGFVPISARGPLLVCRNWWGAWNGAGLRTLAAYALPGDFGIPIPHLSNGVVWECRAAVARPQPKPVPAHFQPSGVTAPFWNWLLTEPAKPTDLIQEALDDQPGGQGWGGLFRSKGMA